MAHSLDAQGAGPVAPKSDEAGSARNAPAPEKLDQQTDAHFSDDGAPRKALATRTALLHDACHCKQGAECQTCTAWRAVLAGVAERTTERTEQALQARLMQLALRHAAGRRRPVRDLPRRLPFDLDALADAVALRLRRST